jgi:multisubunit Na+/H+ antiporter MnhC subunit
MKTFIMALAIVGLVLLSGCWMLGNQEPIRVTVKIEIAGTAQAHIIFNASDFGYKDLPFTSEKTFQSYSGTPSTFVNVQCYSTANIILKVYENNILNHTENGTYINYSN